MWHHGRKAIGLSQYFQLPYNLIWVGGCGININDLAFENLGTFRCMIMLRSSGCKVASVYESVCVTVCVQTSNVCCANMYVPILYYVYMPRNILCMKVYMNVSKIIQICVPLPIWIQLRLGSIKDAAKTNILLSIFNSAMADRFSTSP